jgi:methionyl aminopeptidase
MHNHQALVDASKQVLLKAVQSVHAGMKISDLGHIMETTAKKAGFRVIRNLAGHGVGRKLHEAPDSILNCKDRRNKERFTKNSVIAIETFIATRSNYAVELSDGWTLVGDRGGFVTQHEHTLVVTDDRPIILTHANGIWN